MSITMNPKHWPFVNYPTASQIVLWLEEHLIYYEQFKVSISYSEWLMAPYCISITVRYFPIINDDNNIHIKSIKSIFKVWCIHAIITAQCESITQQVSNTDNRNPSTQSQMSVPGRGTALYLRDQHHLLHCFWAQLHKLQPGSWSEGDCKHGHPTVIS